jgi:polysaccharide export outer membrane protein
MRAESTAMSRTILRVLVSVGAAVFSGLLIATPSEAQSTSKPTQSGTAKPSAQPEVPKPAPPGAPAIRVPDDYVIGVSDVLTIFVYAQDPMLSGDAIVGPDGKISRLLINEIQAAGFTPEQLRMKLTEAYSKYFSDPTIAVAPKQINSRKVFITGMVPKNGSYDLLEPMNVLQLITMAGGLLEYADKEHIILVRKQPLQNGKPDITVFNYNNLFDPKKLDKIPQLKPGDQVVVR